MKRNIKILIGKNINRSYKEAMEMLNNNNYLSYLSLELNILKALKRSKFNERDIILYIGKDFLEWLNNGRKNIIKDIKRGINADL